MTSEIRAQKQQSDIPVSYTHLDVYKRQHGTRGGSRGIACEIKRSFGRQIKIFGFHAARRSFCRAVLESWCKKGEKKLFLRKRLFQLDQRLQLCASMVREGCKMADIGKPAHFGHILYLEGFIGQERFRFFHTGFDEIRFGRTMKKTGVIGIKLAAAQVYKFSHGIAVPFLFAVGEYEVSGFLKLLIKTGGFRFADGLRCV